MPQPQKSSASPRDAAIILGFLAFAAGALLALGWGFGLMVGGFLLLLLAFFGLGLTGGS